LKSGIAIIYRNYDEKISIKKLIAFKKICKKKKYSFYLANNLKIAIRIGLDGAYIPAFNQKLNTITNKPKKFIVIGSAHNIQEIKIKEKQKVDCIFISPLFITSKKNKFLGISRFKKLSIETKKKVVALGGLKKNNLGKIRILNIHGYASISLFKKN